MLGFFAPSEGGTTCTACAAGNYSDKEGSPECTRCPVGTRSVLPLASSLCVECEVGKFAATTGNSQCQQCSADCVVGSRYESTACTNSTDRVCSLCRKALCPAGQTSNVTWCPPASGIFGCMPCPAYGNDQVHLMPEYSCATCESRGCGETPGTFRSQACPSKAGAEPYTLNDTYSCGRCLGCNYRQYVKSWSFCNGLSGTRCLYFSFFFTYLFFIFLI